MTEDEKLLLMAQAITEEHLSQRQLIDTPKEIKDMTAYLLMGIKIIYKVEWSKAISFLDQFCNSYVTNVKTNDCKDHSEQTIDNQTLN